MGMKLSDPSKSPKLTKKRRKAFKVQLAFESFVDWFNKLMRENFKKVSNFFFIFPSFFCLPTKFPRKCNVKDKKMEQLNACLAFFLHDLLSVMDRGFVYSLIKTYMKVLIQCISQLREARELTNLLIS